MARKRPTNCDVVIARAAQVDFADVVVGMCKSCDNQHLYYGEATTADGLRAYIANLTKLADKLATPRALH